MPMPNFTYCTSLIFFFIFSVGSFTYGQTTIWQENFNSYGDNIAAGTGTGASPANWSTHTSFDTAGPVGNKYLQGQNLGGTTRQFLTSAIDITGYTNIILSFSATHSNNLESTDFLRAYYSVDGAPQVEFAYDSGNLNVASFNTFLPDGNSLVVIIEVRNNSADEYYRVDNILIQEDIDTDGDGIVDSIDTDDDGDGIPDTEECTNFLEEGGFNGFTQQINGTPIGNGNNYPVDISPWILGSGDDANIIRVDGAGGYNYGIGGPYSDANPNTGDGEYQYYLDIANGSNDFYQSFTFSALTSVIYSGYFSARDNRTGTGSISIHEGVGTSGTVVATSGVLTIDSGGDSQNAGWTYFEDSAILPAGTYSFVIAMDNDMNFDEAAITRCPDSDGDGIFDDKDLDSDNDGCLDSDEYLFNSSHVTDPSTHTACNPDARDDNFTLCEATATELPVFADNGNGADDFRADGPRTTGPHLEITTPPANGIASVDDRGTTDPMDDVILYTSNSGATTDTFQYRITDDNLDHADI